MQSIPVIDMAPWFTCGAASRDAVARAFDEAARQWGFLVVAGHGVDAALMRNIMAETYAFFDRPTEEKLAVEARGRAGGRGYYRLESKSHARTRGDASAKGDLRETFFAGAEPIANDPATLTDAASRHFAPNIWPEIPACMGTVWRDYAEACQTASAEMLRVCARALGIDDHWFDDKLTRPISTLTAQHYPAQTQAPAPGQVRSGAHTDFGTLTLLMTEDRPGGLQVLGLDDEWHDIRPVPGAYIVNLGDMMARWTNDRWRSALHRVVNPPLDAGSAARRLSIVYFQTPNHDAPIACLPTCHGPDEPARYAPILAGEHLAEKLRQTDSVAAS
jgi:isopenicillin N synthase-like dioxygenase